MQLELPKLQFVPPSTSTSISLTENHSNPQPTVEIEIFRPAQMYLDWPASSATYHIHLDFLRYYSYLFRIQYDAALKYTKTPKLRVAYPELSSLGRFIEYTYSQEIDTANLNHKDFIFLWIFAEKIGAPQLQNYAITCLHDFRRENPSEYEPVEMESFLNIRTAEESPLRRYLSDTSSKNESLADVGSVLVGGKKRKVRVMDYFINEKEVAKAFLEPPEPPEATPLDINEIMKDPRAWSAYIASSGMSRWD